jgi:hypothetical protein
LALSAYEVLLSGLFLLVAMFFAQCVPVAYRLPDAVVTA